MLLKVRALGRQVPLVDTSPNKQVQVMLDKMGFRSLQERRGKVFVLGRWLGRLLGRGRTFPGLPPGKRLVMDVEQVATVARAFMKPERLENWITPEFIRWRVGSPILKLRFIGCVDEAGALSSYIILAEHEIKKQPAWLMVDWFTTSEGIHEVLAMLGELSRDPGMIGEARRMVEAAVFDPEVPLWADAPALVDLPRPASHYFLTPPSLGSCIKRCVLADGDFGM